MSEVNSAEAARRRHDLSEAATRKVFRRLIPFLLLMYVIAFLDRSNVSFAQKEFQADFGISAASYAFGAGLFFVGYAVFEIPSNILLHKVGARWWLARIMVSWGIVAAAFMFVQGPTSFYVLRFLLGVMEAGFFPGVILYLTYWIPARHLSRARGYFYMGIALAGILGNPLSGALLELNGLFGLRGIQWMFLVEGLLAVAVGIWAYFYLTDKPKDATWLPDDERQALVETVDAEDTAKAEGEGPQKVLAALGNWRVWYFALIYFCIQIAVYGVTFFLPTQVTASPVRRSVSQPPWSPPSHGCSACSGWRSSRAWPTAPANTGRSARPCCWRPPSGSSSRVRSAEHPVLAIAGLSLAAMGFVAMQPIFWTLPTEYMTGYAAAAGIGLINSLGNLGGFLAPNMRDYFNHDVGGNAGLYSLAVGALIGAAPVRPDRAVQEGQRDRGRPPRRGRRRPRPALITSRMIHSGRGWGTDADTMTNPTADLTALPPVRVEPDARQRIRKALADAGRRIAVLDDDPTGSQTVHDVTVVTVFDPDEIAAGLDGAGLHLLHPHQHPQHARGRRRRAEHPCRSQLFELSRRLGAPDRRRQPQRLHAARARHRRGRPRWTRVRREVTRPRLRRGAADPGVPGGRPVHRGRRALGAGRGRAAAGRRDRVRPRRHLRLLRLEPAGVRRREERRHHHGRTRCTASPSTTSAAAARSGWPRSSPA